jgi:3'-phosphoadenosine 5'-phosphosulfate sulfotransferase (PAPS reductase)/FAD synthetase
MDAMKHIIGFSGGIDAQATALWAINRFGPDDVILTNTRAGRNESPITDRFIETYSRYVYPIITITPLVEDLWEIDGFGETWDLDGREELTFQRLIELKGKLPSRTGQFCTRVLKLAPLRRWVKENFGPRGLYANEPFEMYTGVCRDEFAVRKNQLWRQWDDYFGCWLNAPLIDWTKKMCFAFVVAHRQDFNPLYQLGFWRVGCAPCINSSTDDILLWQRRFPEMIEKVRGYERATGQVFFGSCVPGLKRNSVDQVIDWAQTDYAGQQKSMLQIIDEPPSFESKYGLCE